MKQRRFLRLLALVFAILAVLAALCAFAVTGGGFLDLSNLVKGAFLGTALVFAILAGVFYQKGS